MVSVICDKMIGSEELNPIFTYCVIKAKPLNWISSLQYMTLMISPSELKSEKGFALTKLQIATNIIENANSSNFKNLNFLEWIL